jgi:hypothetical protein
MRKLLILLILIATPVAADSHGYRLSFGGGTWVMRSKPTTQENHEICKLDGAALEKRLPQFKYSCDPE